MIHINKKGSRFTARGTSRSAIGASDAGTSRFAFVASPALLEIALLSRKLKNACSVFLLSVRRLSYLILSDTIKRYESRLRFLMRTHGVTLALLRVIGDAHKSCALLKIALLSRKLKNACSVFLL